LQTPEIQVEKYIKEIQPHPQTGHGMGFSPQGIANLIKALATARPKFGVIKKSAENPFYKDGHGKPRKYADLAEIIAATAEPLAENGLYVLQAPFIEERFVGITTLLAHESGEWIITTTSGCPADQKLKEGGARFDAQTVGIGFTYLARYGLRAILNLGSEDDDGNGLVSPPAESKKPLQIDKASLHSQMASKTYTSLQSEPSNLPHTASGVTMTSTTDADGCPVSDADVPKDLQLPSPEKLKAIGTLLKSFNQDSRLLKQWIEKEAGTEWKKIPMVKFDTIIHDLTLAFKEGKLTEMITPKE
jgi:hypothetical protein